MIHQDDVTTIFLVLQTPTILNVTQNGTIFRATPVVQKVIQLVPAPAQNTVVQPPKQTWTVTPVKRPVPPPVADDNLEQFYTDGLVWHLFSTVSVFEIVMFL